MSKTLQIPSTDGKNQLHVVVWEPEGKIRAIMQISHGMIEYTERYDEFAQYLNKQGILVIGNDHLGHGHTAPNSVELGYIGAGMSETMVNDLHEVTKYAKREYGEEHPYFLFGHSMGSFLARRYLMTYGKEVQGAIISGTGYTPKAVLVAGSFFAGAIKLFRGERYRSLFLKNLSFSGYNKKIENVRTENDWLSRNEANVDKYNADKYCTFLFTVNGYQTLFGLLKYIQKPENYKKIPKDLPMFFIAGAEDPVGNYGEGVKKVTASYRQAGMENIRTKIYKEDRHELTNETDRYMVYEDVRNWMEHQLKK